MTLILNFFLLIEILSAEGIGTCNMIVLKSKACTTNENCVKARGLCDNPIAVGANYKTIVEACYRNAEKSVSCERVSAALIEKAKAVCRNKSCEIEMEPTK